MHNDNDMLLSNEVARKRSGLGHCVFSTLFSSH